MSIPTCFTGVIGYSRKENVCTSDAWDSSYADSESGLYMDELPGMPQNFIVDLGGNYNIWEKFYYSIENAIRTFQVDVITEIYKYKELSRRRFYGDIGGKSFTSTLSDCGDYRGLRMFSDIRGGTFTLQGISIIMSVAEALTLEIYDEYQLLYSYPITSVAGRPNKTVITPLELDLDRNYYFLYHGHTGLPYNNKLTCNCGGFKWCFCTENPCYHPSREGWTEWAMVGGVCGDTLTDRDDWTPVRDANGLILHGKFECNVIGTLCDEDNSNWTSNEIDLAIAHAIWYKAGEYLSNYIVDSEEICRKTLLGVEQWNNNREFYNTKYKEMIAFIGENFEDERNECLKCKFPHGQSMRSQRL
ncbi:MAG: hypothetical protein ABFC18_03115 [Rikenellaceae bacterium]